MSCTSAQACVAVGYRNVTSGLAVTLAERWDGQSWKIQTTPNPRGAIQSVLGGVSCTSASSCTAAGEFQNSVASVPFAEHWNGSTWAIQTFPSSPGSNGDLFGVSCSSTAACTAVGTRVAGGHELTLAERWNGSRWSIQTTPIPAGATSPIFYGVSCSSATVCIAVGSYIAITRHTVLLAERWNGSSWSIQTIPEPAGSVFSELRSVSCTSTTACTAVGEWGKNTGVTLAEHWNGVRWSIETPRNPAGASLSQLLSVSCPSATACTASGDYMNATGTRLTLAERWNGVSWSLQATPNPTGTERYLFGVSCPVTTFCISVGHFNNSNFKTVPLAERWNGLRWSIQTTP